MAVEQRQGTIGTYGIYKTKQNSVSDIFKVSAFNPLSGQAAITQNMINNSFPIREKGQYTRTLLDFDVLYGNNRVTGTYNPSQGGGRSPVTQDKEFVQAATDILGQNDNFSLGAAQKAVSGNTSTNPFFGEFFNYYLGLAQQRQETLSKTLQRSSTGNNTAGSALGGSLI